MVVHTFSPSPGEAGAGGSLILCKSRTHSELMSQRSSSVFIPEISSAASDSLCSPGWLQAPDPPALDPFNFYTDFLVCIWVYNITLQDVCRQWRGYRSDRWIYPSFQSFIFFWQEQLKATYRTKVPNPAPLHHAGEKDIGSARPSVCRGCEFGS